MILKVVIAIFLLRDTLFMFSRHLCQKFRKIIFHSLLHKKEHFYMLVLCTINFFFNWRVNLVSAIDLPLVQVGMHRLYTGHITHRTRFGIKYYAKNVVPVFCVSCASVWRWWMINIRKCYRKCSFISEIFSLCLSSVLINLLWLSFILLDMFYY